LSPALVREIDLWPGVIKDSKHLSGFTTTKGALVRSMLFPKLIGFKFYRDSIRFIIVLSGIAGFGFCASAVQFVKLGVRPLVDRPCLWR
jgi:magnesium-transporting ATPase (P-type)